MYNNSLSSLAFHSINDAFAYCEERATRVGNMGWRFIDDKNNVYCIYELKVQ